MINAVYYKNDKEFSLEVSGHAGYAAAGTDIVCAAISALTQTLLYSMPEVAENHDYSIHDGYMWLYAKGEKAVVALEVILTGLKQIGEQYNSYLNLIEGCAIQIYPSLV